MGVPRSKLVTMRAGVYATLSNPSTINFLSYQLVSANSINDPDATGIGYQPYGHDQWHEFYAKYIVVGAAIRVTFTSNASINSHGGCVGLHLGDAPSWAAGVSTPQVLLETPRTVMRQWNTRTWDSITLKMGYSPKKFWGLTNLKDVRDYQGASFNANPLHRAYWTVFISGYGYDINSCQVAITVDYKVLMLDPYTLTTS